MTAARPTLDRATTPAPTRTRRPTSGGTDRPPRRTRPLLDQVRDLVGDCLGLTVTGTVGGVAVTLVATDEQAALLDALQHLEGGPCRRVDRGEVVSAGSRDLGSRRWRHLAEEVSQLGVRSALALPLRDGCRVVGAVTVYAASESTPDHDALLALVQPWVETARDQAAGTLDERRSRAAAPRSLRADGLVHRAAGVLAVRLAVDPAAAHERLEDAALHAGLRPERLAQVLLALHP